MIAFLVILLMIIVIGLCIRLTLQILAFLLVKKLRKVLAGLQSPDLDKILKNMRR